MPDVLRFSAPRHVELVDLPSPPLEPDTVRVRTLVSGISAGTEMSAYRGSNPYLHGTWDPEMHLFDTSATQELSYPLDGWGYSEVGEVVEVGPLGDRWAGTVSVGDRVWGIWGHRAEHVIPVERVAGHQIDPALDPAVGTFNRVAAVALNAVLCSEATIGTTVAVVGQGVIGLLATRFAAMTGARVIAVESVPLRRDMARRMGASEVIEPSADVARRVRRAAGAPGGLDAAIELSGTYPGLQSAISLVGPDGIVAAAGFYQGPGALALGTEFHHNRVDLRASQIGSAPRYLHARWTRERLHETAARLLHDSADLVTALVTDRFAFADAAAAYERVDTSPADILQVVLEMAS